MSGSGRVIRGGGWDDWGGLYRGSFRSRLETADRGEALSFRVAYPMRMVIRGGSWYYAAWYCGSSFRNGFNPTDRDYDLGFRVAGGVR